MAQYALCVLCTSCPRCLSSPCVSWVCASPVCESVCPLHVPYERAFVLRAPCICLLSSSCECVRSCGKVPVCVLHAPPVCECVRPSHVACVCLCVRLCGACTMPGVCVCVCAPYVCASACTPLNVACLACACVCAAHCSCETGSPQHSAPAARPWGWTAIWRRPCDCCG
jgi:hypothetical protein